jgi:farnesyl-diphosphate farnesyltransferase
MGPALSYLQIQPLLRGTSRSFYLTLRILPPAVRPQIGLAYLLARSTDTIADTELVPVESRLQALAELRDRITGASSSPLNLARLAPCQASEPERLLLERIEEPLRMLDGLAEEDRRLVRGVLDTIVSGQELDLKRFGSGPAPKLAALETDAELDDYTWRVAGCVGEFWTRLCRARLFPRARVDEQSLLDDGIRFGKGLQLVNILRDIPADLSHGRCYIPRQSLTAAGLTPEDLRSAANEPKFRPLYHALLDRAQEQLQAGWNHTNALPRGQWRLRLACAWPALIGAGTLARLRDGNVLDSTRRIKITRAEVRAIVARSVLLLAWPAAWRSQFSRETTLRKGSHAPGTEGERRGS